MEVLYLYAPAPRHEELGSLLQSPWNKRLRGLVWDSLLSIRKNSKKQLPLFDASMLIRFSGRLPILQLLQLLSRSSGAA